MCSFSVYIDNAVAKKHDEAAIRTVIASVGTLADTSNFEALEKLYTEEVELDYSSLTGGEIDISSSTEIMRQWASVLPGFDGTYHDINNIQISSNGKTATATADVAASHWLGAKFWQVTGDYVYRLVKKNKRWLIHSHQFNLEREAGTRDVLEVATAKAGSHPVSYLKRLKTRLTVRSFLESLESKDMASFAKLWAADAIQEMPYAPDGFPKQVIGSTNIIEHYSGWPSNSGEADFTSEMVFYPMQDPEMVFVEFKGEVHIVPTGRHYSQHYGGLFHVQNGKIKLFREYFNPTPFVYAFGLDENKSIN